MNDQLEDLDPPDGTEGRAAVSGGADAHEPAPGVPPFATGGGGVTFERRVAVSYLALMLTGETAPGLGGRRITSVNFQQAPKSSVDDLVLETEGTGRHLELAIGVRHKPDIVKSDEDTKKLIATFVTGLDKIDTEDREHRLALAVAGRQDHCEELAKLADLAHDQKDAEGFFELVKTPKKFKKAVSSRLTHTTALVTSALAGPNNSHVEDTTARLVTWNLLRRLEVLMLDIEAPYEQVWADITNRLTAVARGRDLDGGEKLRDRLVALAADWSPNAATVDLNLLRRDVHGLLDGPATRHAAGWDRLHQVHQDALAAVSTQLGQDEPDGTLRLDRGDKAEALMAAVRSSEALVVHGNSGTGKSALTLQTATAAAAGKPDQVEVLCLNLRQLPEAPLSLTADLGDSVEQHLRELSAPVRLLVLDAADAVAEGRRDLFIHLVTGARASGVRVAAVVSSEHRTLVGDLLQEHRGHPAVEWQLGLLDDEELDAVTAAFPQLGRIAAEPRSRPLLRRLVVVDLLVRAAVNDAVLMSDWDAMQAVWAGLFRRREVSDCGSPEAREQVLLGLAAWELAGRKPVTARPSLDPQGVDGLRRDGVLLPANANPWEPSPRFSHDEIRRYALARFLLSTGDPAGALKELSAPRWALSAALLATQGLLSERTPAGQPPPGLYARTQRAFDELAASGAGPRWADIPTEALHALGLSHDLLHDAWDHLNEHGGSGIDRLLRILDQRHSDSPLLTDSTTAEPVVRLLLSHPTPWKSRPAALALLLRWSRSLVLHNVPAGHGLRISLRERLLAFCAAADQRAASAERAAAAERARRTADEIRQDEEYERALRDFEPPGHRGKDRPHVPSEIIRKEIVELLALLGPDLTADGESLLRRVASAEPWSLVPALDRPGTARALAAYDPALLADLTLSYYLDDENYHRRSNHDGIREHDLYGPITPSAAWYRGPFNDLLRTAPVRAVAVINQLLNHAARNRAILIARLGNPFGPAPSVPSEPVHVVLEITGQAVTYVGDADVWSWYRGTTTGPYPCMSALQALERICDQLIDVGLPLDRIMGMLLDGCENLATPALVVSMLTRHLEQAGTLLDPFLTEPMIWDLEINRVVLESSGLAADSDGLKAAERRLWSFAEVAAHLAAQASPSRADELRAVGTALAAKATAIKNDRQDATLGAAGPTSPESPGNGQSPELDESRPAVAQGWAALLDHDNYVQYDSGGGPQSYFLPPAELRNLMEEQTEIERGLETIRISERYFIRARSKPTEFELAGADELIADLDSVRALLDNPPTLTAVPPGEAAAHVCQAVLEAVTLRSVKLPPERVMFAATMTLDIALKARSLTQRQDPVTCMGQLFDRSAARALPLLLLPEAAIRAAFDHDQLKAAGMSLARAGANETRLYLARRCDPIWASPCSGTSDCPHRIALAWIIESMRDCVYGSFDQQARRQPNTELAEPVASALAVVDPADLDIGRLDAAIRGCGAAAVSGSCVQDESRSLLDSLLTAQRQALAARKNADDRSTHSLVAARTLWGLAAAGEPGNLREYLDAYGSHTRMLISMLFALAAAAPETVDSARAAQQLWPEIIYQGLAFQSRNPSPFGGGFFGDEALAALMPNPIRHQTMLHSEAPSPPFDWIDPLAWREPIEEWLVAAKGRHRCIETLIATLSVMPVADQATTGVRWLSILCLDDTERVVGRTDRLATWLIDVKPHIESDGEIDQWQRLVDALVVAGDRQLAPHST